MLTQIRLYPNGDFATGSNEVETVCRRVNPDDWKGSDDTKYSCSGWKLYDENGAVVDSGSGTSFTYTHPTPAAYRRLEWQWKEGAGVGLLIFVR